MDLMKLSEKEVIASLRKPVEKKKPLRKIIDQAMGIEAPLEQELKEVVPGLHMQDINNRVAE